MYIFWWVPVRNHCISLMFFVFTVSKKQIVFLSCVTIRQSEDAVTDEDKITIKHYRLWSQKIGQRVPKQELV